MLFLKVFIIDIAFLQLLMITLQIIPTSKDVNIFRRSLKNLVYNKY